MILGLLGLIGILLRLSGYKEGKNKDKMVPIIVLKDQQNEWTNDLVPLQLHTYVAIFIFVFVNLYLCVCVFLFVYSFCVFVFA